MRRLMVPRDLPAGSWMAVPSTRSLSMKARDGLVESALSLMLALLRAVEYLKRMLA